MMKQPNSKVEHLKLIKTEDKQLTLLQNEELKKEICISITKGECTIPEDIVKLFKIPYDQVINLLSDTSFLTLINKHTQSKLQLLFHTQVPNKLQKIINSEDNKESLQAIKLAAQLSNNLKTSIIDINNNVQLNLESLVKEASEVPPINIEDFPKGILMKKLLLAVSLLPLIASFAYSQQNFKIGFGYANTRYNTNPLEALEYTNGFEVSAEGTEFNFNKFRLSGLVTFQNDFSNPTDVYGFGQKLSYGIGKGRVVEPFVEFTFNLETQYEGHNEVSRTLGYGVDLNAGNFYFRPLKVKERRVGGLFSPSERTFVFGGGFRF